MASEPESFCPPTFVAGILGTGAVGPISELVGRRRVRHIDAGSPEGRRLLNSGVVTILARDGRRFTGMPIAEVFDSLAGDLSREAADPHTDPRAIPDLGLLLSELQRQRRSYS